MQVIREIKRGGFGVVEEVTRDGQIYARKTFSPNSLGDPNTIQKAKKRFVRESTIQKAIKHPNIMPVFEVNTQNDPPWFLMPLADESYDEQIQRDRLARKITLQPLLDILAGIEELHRMGYVHRDLKPANVLYLNNRWVLSDFGLAVPTDRTTTMLTSTDSAWGTELYSAPELTLDFRNAQSQADIYSFGCILHDIVGEPTRIPYSQIKNDSLLGPIIERCTETQPNHRFPDVASLRSALVLVLSNESLPIGTDQAQEWVNLLKTDVASINEITWKEIIHRIKRDLNSADAQVLLRAIDITQLENLFGLSKELFSQLIPLICEWIQENQFEFAYCDVLGTLLFKIYELGGIREKADAAIATFILGGSHNRWFVMRKFVSMANNSISQDLADRLAIEFLALGWRALRYVEKIETQTRADRNNLHPRIQEALNELSKQCDSSRN
ncbi:MAG: serine/threonine protein kinase [Anaerolineae bacterium]|nr:serine/threonine protein kinase [Anaerolineae bacterium]